MNKKLRPQTETAIILDFIKTMMKQKGLLYKDLADYLGLSLPTIKRTFTGGELTIDRLSKISDWLGISMAEMIKLSGVSQDKKFHFTEEQEIFFSTNPHFLAYLTSVRPKTSSQVGH